MPLWNRAAVVGLQGVGKTSLCQEASSGYNYVNFGELMVDISQERKLANTLDEMLHLKAHIQYDIWKSAARKLINIKNLLVDLHGVDLTRAGYLISLPYEFIPPEIIIIIKSPYEELLKRRWMDKSKTRAIQFEKDINDDFSILKSTMAGICSFLGSVFVILENDDFEKCIEELKNVLKNPNY
jgi:adenylate kinase